MTQTEILYSVGDHIATITLNRPDKLNAWTAQMATEVRAALAAAEDDDGVRVIVLTGAGRGFCAGADMSLLRNLAASGQPAAHSAQISGRSESDGFRPGVPADFQGKYSYFPSLRKPVIGAINGPAVGLGFVIALYCDLRFASDATRFGTAFARRGLIAEYGMAWMLPRLIGIANALDLLLSARLIDAAEAARMGLVNGVFPADQFLKNVRAYARELAAAVSPRSMAVIKRQVYDGLLQRLDEANAVAEKAMLESLQSEDFKEGVAHFLEKRAPAFTGR